MSELRRRGKKTGSSAASAAASEETKVHNPVAVKPAEPEHKYYLALALVTIFAIYTRFTNISHPSKVVFDEVHFGKFASYYLERTYFFDLHPPFAKLLIAAVGWIVGYDGAFKFDNIGDDYVKYNVPYIAYRAFSAIQGTLTVPVMFLSLKTVGYSVPACTFAAVLVCFDNAHITDSRLILLDATLNLSVAVTIFCYFNFVTYRNVPFTKKWWSWLTATGVALSCVISTKYVGVLTYVTIGIGVLYELWILLDYRRGLSNVKLAQHFFARLWCLIIFPFIIYLFWFYVHFSILTKSGPGDNFMTSEFQETLIESPMARLAKQVNYHDVVSIKHKDTGALLHSHLADYPLRYEDGRISSNTQQVTCVVDGEAAVDINSQWEIIPTTDVKQGQAVYTNDVIRLKHVGTGGYLLTHDVASPLRSTNEEFTITYDDEKYSQAYNESLFRLRHSTANSKNKRKLVKTKAVPLKVIHVDTVVAMWTHDDEVLPEWGFGHQEVSGNKKLQDMDNTWTFDEILNMPEDDKRREYVPKTLRKIPFLKKWWELQGLMFYHNNQLSSEHPFASQPDAWPLALSGVSFWNDNTERKQIFFIGNVIGFWLEVAFLAIYVGILLADQLTRRRGIYLLHDRARSRLYNSLGFLFAGWAAHYLPFFLMNRQKFLHHYLPAHLIAALFSGALVEFICSSNRVGAKTAGVDKKKIITLVSICTVAVAWFFFYFRPITYGDISLPVEEVKKRNWLDIKLHYAK
ncbi:Dolichyl-phosphate-mannose--protein mannosyltransferase 4 [Meyerozyma sp. JA9]|nr:Dolichyl-phosphate-mannose--protein mannosyltransferase 4 [Meyerozyma sp. JA9]